MLALALAASLSTVAAATPRPLPNADSGVYVPRIDRLGGLVEFMDRAGTRSVMLRPKTWFSQFHPLLYVDFTRLDSLRASGIDTSGSTTVSFRKDGWMNCSELSDSKKFAEHAKQRLATFGEVTEGKRHGIAIVTAKATDGAIRAGYAQKGKVTCAIVSANNGEGLLDAAVTAVAHPVLSGGWRGTKGLSGVAFLVMPEGVAGLSGSNGTLEVDGRASELPVPPLQKGARSPYAEMTPPGLLVARAAIAQKDVPGAVRSLIARVSQLCAKCDREKVSALQKALAEELTGNVALAVNSLHVSGRLSSDAQRFFAARQVWLAELRDPEAATKALAQLESWPGARKSGEGFAIPIEGGEVQVGVHGDHLFLANDAKALAAGLAAIPKKSGKLSHGVELELDPAKTSRSLEQISFFDVIGSKELAGLFAASTELGPVLGISKALNGWADSNGRFGGTWAINAP